MGCLEADTRPYLVVPLGRHQEILGRFEAFYSGFDNISDPIVRGPDGMSTLFLDFAIENRGLVPWIGVPLLSDSSHPMLFVSYDAAILREVVEAVVLVSPDALVSVWRGPAGSGA